MIDLKVHIPNKKSPVRFLKELTSELLVMFEVNDVIHLPENYGTKYHWSLLNAVKNSQIIDSYCLLYKDGRCLGGGGGRIIDYLDKHTYQAGWRTFIHKDPEERLGKYPHFVQTVLSWQIERAKDIGASEAILSFNAENEVLFKVMKRRLTNNLQIEWWADLHLKQFNGVPQWLIHIPL